MKSLWLLVILDVLMVQVISSTPVNTTDNDNYNGNDHTNSSGSGDAAGGASLDPADLVVGEQDDDDGGDDMDDDEPPPSSSFVAEICAHLEGLWLQPTTVTMAKAGGN